MTIQAPKMGVLGNFGPLNVIIHHRDPKQAHQTVKFVFTEELTVTGYLSEYRVRVTFGLVLVLFCEYSIHTGRCGISTE